jgi:hypothetical protein
MFAPAYMGRGWAFSNAFCSLHEDVGIGNRPFASIAEALEGLRPVFFGPCTPVRTWGTRPIPIGSCCDTDSLLHTSSKPAIC